MSEARARHCSELLAAAAHSKYSHSGRERQILVNFKSTGLGSVHLLILWNPESAVGRAAQPRALER
jgi:hypothetical protein